LEYRFLCRWEGTRTPEEKSPYRPRLEIRRRDSGGPDRWAVDRKASCSAARVQRRDRLRNLLASLKQHLTREAGKKRAITTDFRPWTH
jgi:hypothetical protein